MQERKEKPKTIIARIDSELDKRLRHHLIDTGKSQQAFLNEAIKEKLDRDQENLILGKRG